MMRSNSSFSLRLSLALLLLAALVSAHATAQPPAKQTTTVEMRDGVKLAIDLYLPEGKGPFPVILLRTPYDKNGGAGIGADGVKHGYAIVVQDTRGRFASGGENLPFEGDGWWAGHEDGYDTLAWIAKQPWCNGKIGTFGGSALGITQIGLAGTGTPYLTAQHISVAPPDMYHHGVFPGGVFKKAMIEDWLRVTKHSPDALAFWTKHTAFDDFWLERDLSARWKNANAPAVHIGGWFDIFGQGTLDAFQGYQTEGGPKARGKQKLVMGPWTHGILQNKAGQLTFPNGNHPANNAHDPWRWFDYQLKGDNNAMAALPAVTYYVMGDTSDPNAPGNVWRTAEHWPPFDTRLTPYYFRADHGLTLARPTSGDPIAYAYDPKNPVPTTGGPQLTLPPGPMEQSAVEKRPDVVVFTSEPLTAPLEVTGRVRIHLYAATDAPDTDFFAKLCDVAPDGRSFNICEGQIRARFHDGFRREKPIKLGEIVRYEIDLWSTSMIFNKGHRLRVQVTSSNAPGYDPNPNTGEPFRASATTRIAHNTIYVDARHASHIELPLPRQKPR